VSSTRAFFNSVASISPESADPDFADDDRDRAVFGAMGDSMRLPLLLL
jgi:hypothetical protein